MMSYFRIFRTTESAGACFIRTDQLDGETDWKLRLAVPSTQRLTKELTGSFRGCHLLDARLDAYPGLEDDWLEVLCDVAPGLCLISLNGCHALTSSGLRHMSVCTAVTHLNLGKGTFSLSYHRSTWKSPRPFSTFETKPPLPSGFVDSLSC